MQISFSSVDFVQRNESCLVYDRRLTFDQSSPMATSVQRAVQFGNFTEDEVTDLFSKDIGELEVGSLSNICCHSSCGSSFVSIHTIVWSSSLLSFFSVCVAREPTDNELNR